MAEHHRPPHNITAFLPTDILLFQILPWLPGKSVSRFKCVSKQWNSFLSSTLFTNMHLDRHQNNHKLLLISNTKPCAFHTINCEALDDGLTVGRRLPFFVRDSKNITILASCNGLVCIGITTQGNESYMYSCMILWNPLTGEYKTMSKADYRTKCYKVAGSASELFYSASDDDYKVLRVTDEGDAFIYSLKVDSWTQLSSTNPLKHGHERVWGASVLHHGKLYFVDEGGRLVVRFDTNTESFTVMESPCGSDETIECLNAMLLHKHRDLHLCVIYYRENSTEVGGKLWRLERDRDWKEVVKYEIPRKLYSLKPLYMKKNGNWVTVCRSGCDVNEIDPSRNFEKSANVKPAHGLEMPRKGIYIETFVSPNRKME